LKSSSNRSAPALALLMVLGLWGSAAPGGVSARGATGVGYDPVEPAGERQRPSGDREFPTSRETSQRNRSDSVIKCWQYGRLILDEPDWKAADPGTAGPVLHAEQGPYARMKLMQFGHTFCTLKQGAR